MVEKTVKGPTIQLNLSNSTPFQIQRKRKSREKKKRVRQKNGVAITKIKANQEWKRDRESTCALRTRDVYIVMERLLQRINRNANKNTDWCWQQPNGRMELKEENDKQSINNKEKIIKTFKCTPKCKHKLIWCGRC